MRSKSKTQIDFSDGHALGPDEFSVDDNADRLGRVCENVLVQRSDRVFRFHSAIDCIVKYGEIEVKGWTEKKPLFCSIVWKALRMWSD
ncbi:hypothetical protein U1Q18_017296 [Sarracenia purpurea var. burkii]